MSNELIPARTLKGFSDQLPHVARHQAHLVATASDVYESHGFGPIRTPALEYAEVLTGKGGGENEKQMFTFKDQGGRQVGLRFDLTVPLARYVAQHASVLNLPLRAYHVGRVWRGDRPQRGRYREFVQCDADILGAPGRTSDAEIMAVASVALTEMGLDTAYIRMNHRALLNAVLAGLGVPEGLWIPVLRALDRLDKVESEDVVKELAELGTPAGSIPSLMAFTSESSADNDTTLSRVADDFSHLAGVDAALEDVEETLKLVHAIGGAKTRVLFDPRIMRGLDYYTGMVYEIALSDVPEVGSIGGGGRYDNLSGMFMKQPVSGVGGTLGITRILAAMEQRGDVASGFRRRPLVAITVPEVGSAVPVAEMARLLRGACLCDVTMYPKPAKHSIQMRWANREGAVAVVTLDGPDEVSVKDLVSGERQKSKIADLGETIANLLRLDTAQ